VRRRSRGGGDGRSRGDLGEVAWEAVENESFGTLRGIDVLLDDVDHHFIRHHLSSSHGLLRQLPGWRFFLNRLGDEQRGGERSKGVRRILSQLARQQLVSRQTHTGRGTREEAKELWCLPEKFARAEVA